MSGECGKAEKEVLRKQANWEDLFFYQKTNVLYQLTYAFTKCFLSRGDRTIDPMVQAARSGKQNNLDNLDGLGKNYKKIRLYSNYERFDIDIEWWNGQRDDAV